MSNSNNLNLQLLYSTSYAESFHAYETYIHAQGLHSMSYAFIPHDPFKHRKNITPRFSISEEFNRHFIEEYQYREFQNHDYIIDAINKGVENKLCHWSQDRRNGTLTDLQNNILDKMESHYGMGNGFSIITAKSKHGIGGISLIGDATDKSFSQYIKDNKDDIRIATENFHNHIVTRSYEVSAFIIPTMFFKLSKTERQVLKCLLEGLSVPQTAEKVCRSGYYISKLVGDIRIKVGGEHSNGRPRISKDMLISFCSLMNIHDEL